MDANLLRRANLLRQIWAMVVPDPMPDSQMAELYRPLVRGFCAIVVGYYLILGTTIQPFLEGSHLSLVMVPLRIGLAAAGAAAFWFTRGTTSMKRLELVSLTLSLLMVLTFSVNQLTEFRAHALFTYVIILIIIGAVSPSIRIMILNSAACVAAWLYVTRLHVPDLLSTQVAIAIPGVVVTCLLWGLLNRTLGAARRALTLAEQRGDELERFAYICSHDMQEPVRMMNTYAGFLEQDAAERLGEDGQRHVRLIRENAARMQQMIRDILAFSRVGREGVEIETVDSGAVAAAVLAEFESVIAVSGARVRCDNLPVVKASRTLVTLVLQNLIGNALKFQDGTRPPEISVSARPAGRQWRFEVRDNGIGIDPVYRDKVFALFQRLNRKEDYPGTGIGLSTCRKFLRLYGGEIDFESTPGQGATFWFTLPRTEAAIMQK